MIDKFKATTENGQTFMVKTIRRMEVDEGEKADVVVKTAPVMLRSAKSRLDAARDSLINAEAVMVAVNVARADYDKKVAAAEALKKENEDAKT